MREHPILMRDDMAQATWEGRKTATVRPLGRFKGLKVGDRLWVRECFCSTEDEYDPEEGFQTRRGREYYRAISGPDPISECYPWRPSIHMPRWATRTVVTVAEVFESTIRRLTDEWAAMEGFDSTDAFRAAVASIYPGALDSGAKFRCIRWAPFDKSIPLSEVPHD